MALTQLTDGVRVHESECLQSNSLIVQGDDGVLLVDPGLTRDELAGIAADLEADVVAGFATHPHWDHVLWHPAFGNVPRYATAGGAAVLQDLLAQPDWREQVAEGLPPEIAGEVPMELLGLVTALPEGARTLPWNGPVATVMEHRAHERGHAALLIEERRVLAAGDMLSDVLVPMLDFAGGADPIGDYLAALDLIAGLADRVEFAVPGHGSVARGDEIRRRIHQDRAYVHALRDGLDPDDARIGPDAAPGWEWVVFIHEAQAEAVAARH